MLRGLAAFHLRRLLPCPSRLSRKRLSTLTRGCPASRARHQPPSSHRYHRRLGAQGHSQYRRLGQILQRPHDLGIREGHLARRVVPGEVERAPGTGHGRLGSLRLTLAMTASLRACCDPMGPIKSHHFIGVRRSKPADIPAAFAAFLAFSAFRRARARSRGAHVRERFHRSPAPARKAGARPPSPPEPEAGWRGC